MVPLTRPVTVGLLAAVLALLGPALTPASARTMVPAGSEDEAGTSGEDQAGVDPLELAEQAYLAADFERAERLATSVVDGAPADQDPARRARALGVIVQSLYNLGRSKEVDPAIDDMIRAAPLYSLDPAVAGPKLVERIDARRRLLVGYVDVTCEPLACEAVLVDGRLAPRDSEGRVAALVGTRSLTLRRHNFEDHSIDAVEVSAGRVVELVAELVQTSRDVQLATMPEGVEVLLDGDPVGVTKVAEGAGVASLELRNVPPGVHVLELQRPCYRRVERRLDVVLDRLDPGPLDVGTIEMSRARATVDLTWDRVEGVLSLDGRSVAPGRQEVCPGDHEASLSLGGQRAWVETFTIAENENVSLAPRPRPTLAFVDGQGMPPGFPGDGWNVIVVDSAGKDGPASAFEAEIERRLKDEPAPARPARRLERTEGIGAAARSLAPEADLVAVWLVRGAAVRPTQELVLIDPALELLETTAWPAASDAAGEAARLLDKAAARAEPFAGLDLADRRTGSPVVAEVHPRGPAAAAGLAPGTIVLALGGEPLASSSAFLEHLAAIEPPAKISLRVSQGGDVRDVELDVDANVAISTPQSWRERLLLPELAHAETARVAGSGAERLIGTLTGGMILAAAGRAEDAALALDRSAIDAALDPSGDARGTVLFVLERLFRELGNPGYADEVAARRQALERARFGGRLGPELSAAGADRPD